MYLIDGQSGLEVDEIARTTQGGTVLYLRVVSVDRGLRRAASVVTEAWCGAAAAVRMLRSQGQQLAAGPHARELRLGNLRRHPVMLVHGLGADKSCFSAMEAHLHRAGYTVYSVSYSCFGSDIEACARDLEREAAWVLEETGADRVHVVAHSLGGVVLRWAAAHTRLRDWLSIGITLGSPHRGTPTARLAPHGLPGLGKIVSQLRPGALPMDDAALGGAPGTRWVAIAGENDVVVPARYARLPASGNVRNAVVSSSGHMTLTRNTHCLAMILEELGAADQIVAQPRRVHAVPTEAQVLPLTG